MKHLLVPLGISKNAENTLRFAIDFAAQTKAIIYVLDSFNPSVTNMHLINVKGMVERNNLQRLKALIKSVDHRGVKIQLVSYEGDFWRGIDTLDEKKGVDLIISGTVPNSNDQEIFLGPTSGRLVKKTDIPVLIIPEGITFTPPKKILFAFKKGKIEGERSLDPVSFFQEKFNPKILLLLVKTPGKARKDLQIDHEIVEISDQMSSTENATVYQGVLEYFRETQPDLLVVFARKRGFFEKLIETDVVYKKDFFTKVPLLILKNRN